MGIRIGDWLSKQHIFKNIEKLTKNEHVWERVEKITNKWEEGKGMRLIVHIEDTDKDESQVLINTDKLYELLRNIESEEGVSSFFVELDKDYTPGDSSVAIYMASREEK